jgi:hypothetical protein
MKTTNNNPDPRRTFLSSQASACRAGTSALAQAFDFKPN